MSICIIFNPSARGEKALKFRKMLEDLRGNWALKPTTGPGVARGLAAEAVGQGYETIIAAGGDGTLNEVLNGIIDAPNGLQRSRLGVIPLGTVNVFAREVRLPSNLKKLWPILEACHETSLDIGCADFHAGGKPEKRYFVQLAGAGLDARSIELVNWELKKKAGPAAYVLAGFQALGSAASKVVIGNGSETRTGDLVLIGNGKFYGGSFPLFHKSDLQDGVLDAVIFPEVNWTTLPRYFWDFISGRMFREGGLEYLQGKQFTLSSSGHAGLQLEGEFVGELPATITVVPRALRVVVP